MNKTNQINQARYALNATVTQNVQDLDKDPRHVENQTQEVDDDKKEKA